MKFHELENVHKALAKARENSLQSIHHSARIGAVVMQKSVVLSAGFNQLGKTHPYLREAGEYFHESLHAEMNAIFKIKNKEKLEGATVLVYREDRNGHLAMSRPCEMCQKLLQRYKVKKVIYTTNNGLVEELVENFSVSK